MSDGTATTPQRSATEWACRYLNFVEGILRAFIEPTVPLDDELDTRTVAYIVIRQTFQLARETFQTVAEQTERPT